MWRGPSTGFCLASDFSSTVRRMLSWTAKKVNHPVTKLYSFYFCIIFHLSQLYKTFQNSLITSRNFFSFFKLFINCNFFSNHFYHSISDHNPPQFYVHQFKTCLITAAVEEKWNFNFLFVLKLSACNESYYLIKNNNIIKEVFIPSTKDWNQVICQLLFKMLDL